jgi:hypothetical protein
MSHGNMKENIRAPDKHFPIVRVSSTGLFDIDNDSTRMSYRNIMEYDGLSMTCKLSYTSTLTHDYRAKSTFGACSNSLSLSFSSVLTRLRTSIVFATTSIPNVFIDISFRVVKCCYKCCSCSLDCSL